MVLQHWFASKYIRKLEQKKINKTLLHELFREGSRGGAGEIMPSGNTQVLYFLKKKSSHYFLLDLVNPSISTRLVSIQG